jgi:hypothetical protein
MAFDIRESDQREHLPHILSLSDNISKKSQDSFHEAFCGVPGIAGLSLAEYLSRLLRLLSYDASVPTAAFGYQ